MGEMSLTQVDFVGFSSFPPDPSLQQLNCESHKTEFDDSNSQLSLWRSEIDKSQATRQSRTRVSPLRLSALKVQRILPPRDLFYREKHGPII